MEVPRVLGTLCQEWGQRADIYFLSWSIIVLHVIFKKLKFIYVMCSDIILAIILYLMSFKNRSVEV